MGSIAWVLATSVAIGSLEPADASTVTPPTDAPGDPPTEDPPPSDETADPTGLASKSDAPASADEPPPVTTSPFPPPSEADLERLRSLHVKALDHREAWRTTRDIEQLQRAKATLMLWLIEHQRIFGSDASTADARATVEAQLRDVDAELKAVQPAAPVALDPKIARKVEVMRDRELTAKYRAAENMAIAGYVCLGVGAGTLLFVALPAWRLEELALDRLDDEDRLFTTDEELLERAERRRRISLVSLGIGAATLVTGAVLTGVGLGRRTKLLRPRDLAIAPAVGPGGYGVAASFRF